MVARFCKNCDLGTDKNVLSGQVTCLKDGIAVDVLYTCPDWVNEASQSPSRTFSSDTGMVLTLKKLGGVELKPDD